jgi:two-component system cell cycle sensor histidine kinase/response regulator CckA
VDDTLTAGALGATGPFVMLAVSDTGCGMDTSTQARIFEPFFTTKELGKGTGLGLSIVYGIVEQSAGHIKVFSEPGHGARFEILFPRFEMLGENPDLTVLPSQLPVGSDTSSMVRLPLSSEAVTILLADDDPGVRELTQLVLEHQGYRVFACANGVEAIEHARQHPASIHLLLTDVAMPEMGGEELVAQFAACCPGIPVLYMSAYHDKQRAGIAAVGCLLKPFTPAALLESVRTRLNACDASG